MAPPTAKRSYLNSLAARLIAAAAIWTMLGLAVGGVFLSSAFRNAALSNFDNRLSGDMDGLIAAAEPDTNGGVTLQDRFVNRQFDRVYSGLYFQIKPVAKGRGGQISRSLFDREIAAPVPMRADQPAWGFADGPDNQHLRVVSRRVEFPITATPDRTDAQTYVFSVAGNLAQVDAESAGFNDSLIWSFLVLGLGLVIAVFLQVRVGLLPLRRLRQSLARIRDGKAQRLEGDFPAEIAPLAGELNALIEHSAEVVGRARTHVSNLAHFLKTPLSVLASEADASPGPLADQVKRQVGSMRRQVDHYLARARAAGSVNVLGNRTEISPVLNDLARVLMRIHADRRIAIDVDCPAGLAFRGERQDLEEMAGNLIDNACKWAHARVKVTVVPAHSQSGSAMFTLTVDDDGAGLTEEERAKVGERGERLDESVPGSGLGLAIVRDISKLYAGFFALNASELGGLKTTLTLPLIG